MSLSTGNSEVSINDTEQLCVNDFVKVTTQWTSHWRLQQFNDDSVLKGTGKLMHFISISFSGYYKSLHKF